MTLNIGPTSLVSQTGVAKAGISIPVGSLDIAKAAYLAAGAARTEWVVFGDSTSAGSAISPGRVPFSWVAYLRYLLSLDGFDGGKGVVGFEDTSVNLDVTDNVAAIQSFGTGWSNGSGNDQMLTSSLRSTTVNDSLLVQGYATSARINYSKRTDCAGFAYSFNGGAETIVEADANGFSCESVLITGMPGAALNTVKVRNIGTALVRQPTTFTGSSSTASGTLAGTYYYKATSVDSVGGETLPIAAIGPLTLASAGNVSGQFSGLRSDGAFTNATSYKVYRSTTLGGTYQLIATVTNTGGDGNQAWTDDGSGTPGANAPTSATSGRNTVASRNGTSVAVDLLKSTGVTVHRNAISGISSNSYFSYSNSTNYGAFQAQNALGLVSNVTGSINSLDTGTAQATRPQYRNPSLAIFALGVNDMQGLTVAAGQSGQPTTAEQDAANRAIQFYANAVEHFIKLTRNAGADPLIVIPHYDMAQWNHFFGGAFISAAAGVCRAHGVASIDFHQALGPINQRAGRGYQVSVHTNEAAYTAEATFLYNAVKSYFTA